MDDSLSFGELLRLFRDAKSLTQDDLARSSGVGLRTIEDLERGARGKKQGPRPETLRRLAEALELSRDDRSIFVAAARRRATTSRHSPVLISVGRLPVTPGPFVGREKELALLDHAWAQRKANVISLIASGGVGKSTLINHWLQTLLNDGYRGAELVLGWSFHSQGTERIASADLFVDFALRWLGETSILHQSPWDKGHRLAELIKAKRSLLVLDGVEPMQFPPGQDEGSIRDPALQALVRELAINNEGLCILTTRLPVADLEGVDEPVVGKIDLEYLAPEDGAQLLRALGVRGPEQELQQAAAEYGGHCLALSLLASYIRDLYNGDVGRRREIGPMESEPRRGGHAFRIMVAYERWFSKGPELAVLRLLGLFDRPASSGVVDAVRAAPSIPALTEPLQEISEQAWKQALANLRRASLLSAKKPEQPDDLDAHPLVREHFGLQLRRKHPEAWVMGHRRIYEYLRGSVPDMPVNLEQLDTLYSAVVHACQANYHQEALYELYQERIQRGEQYYSIREFGAFGIDLAALAHFFEVPWVRPVSTLTDDAKGYLLAQVGTRLRALGWLTEAIQPLNKGIEFAIAKEDWRHAAIYSRVLTELQVTTGSLHSAVALAKQGVSLADFSGDTYEKMAERATLGYALHRAGDLLNAHAAFGEAEELQATMHPQCPLLSALWGFRYCDLLLDQGAYQEVHERVIQTMSWAKQKLLSESWGLLNLPLEHLSLGRAQLIQATQLGPTYLIAASDNIERAVKGLRDAGRRDFLPLGILAESEWWRVTGNYAKARLTLEEALTISIDGQMQLYQADIWLAFARVYFAEGDLDKSQETLINARSLVERMSYHLRCKDVTELEQIFGRTYQCSHSTISADREP